MKRKLKTSETFVIRVLMFIMIIVACYLTYNTLIYFTQVSVATEIEKAAYRDCSIDLKVEPETFDVYDIPYWSNDINVSGESSLHISCLMPASATEWQCKCTSSNN